jgi:L-malate glycosyltransferase
VQTFHQKADTFGALIVWLSGVRHLISSKRDTGDLRKPLHKFLNRHLRGLFEGFIMVADGVRVAVSARDRLPPELICTIYNGVDTAWFAPPADEQRQAARERLGLAPEDSVVGMVAGFRAEKNHEVFFAGAERALAAVPSLKVLAVGGGELLETYRRRVADSRLAPRTIFAGEITDVRPWLWAMDVGCLTSGSNEGFSNAVIEQMATGLPMIVTDVGGNAEAVVDGATGLVIPPNDAAAVGAALERMFADRTRTREMGRAARQRVEERFSLEAMCAAHARLYSALVRPVAATP